MGPTLPPQNRPWLLAPDEERGIRAAWAAGARRDEICRAFGISRDRLVARLGDQLRDLPRRGRGTGGAHRGHDPSPAEIELATATLRRGWSEDRWLGRSPESDGP